MKTFKQFQEETQQLDEIAPALALIPAALKLGGAALTAYSAGSALNNLRKGKFKQAGLDALGAIPGGKIFKAAKFLGAGKNVARAGSALQSANRLNLTGMTPNAYAKGFDAVTSAPFKAFAKNKDNKNKTVTNASQVKVNKGDEKKKVDPNSFKMVTASTKLGTTKKKTATA